MKRTGFIIMALVLWLGAMGQIATGVDTTMLAETAALSDSVDSDQSSSNVKIKNFVARSVDDALNTRVEDVNNDSEVKKVFSILLLTVVLPLLIVFIAVIIIVFLNNRSRKERERMRQELYMKALESGQPLPEKFFEEPEQKKSELQSALVLLAVGVSFLFLALIIGNSGLYFATIPGFIGLGKLIAWYIEKPKKGTEAHDE